MGIFYSDCEVTFTGGKRGWRGDVPYVNLDTKKIRDLGWIPKLNSDGAIKKAIHEIVLQLTDAKNKGDK